MDASPTANYATVNAGTFYPQVPRISNSKETDNGKADPASGCRISQYPTASFLQFRSVVDGVEVSYRSQG